MVAQSGHKPFGDNWYETGGTNKLKFTSYERDAEGSAANDYAMARYDMNRLGRFSSPDPLAGSIADPQSLNRYAYTRNDPVNLIDPLGLQEEAGGIGCWMGFWSPWLTIGTNTYWSFIPLFNVPCNFGGSRLGEEKPTRFEQKEQERADQEKPQTGKRQLSREERLKLFNQCVEDARKQKNDKLKEATAEMVAGGLLTLAFTAAAKVAVPAVAEEAATATTVTAIVLSRVEIIDLALYRGPAFFGVSLGIFLKGAVDARKAISDFDRAVADCQAKYGYPNVK